MALQREKDDFFLDTMPASNGVPVWEREAEVTAKTQTLTGGIKRRGRESQRQRQRETLS